MGKAKEASKQPMEAAPLSTPAVGMADQIDRVDILTSAKRVQPGEPEDAYLTGDRRSLRRRLLGLNLPEANLRPGQGSVPPPAAKPAGRAATVVPLASGVARGVSPEIVKTGSRKRTKKSDSGIHPVS